MNSPFNEAKYKVLLEGLEVSILSFSEIHNLNFTQRIDSEYFKKKFLSDDFSLNQIGYDRIENIAIVKGGKRLPFGETFNDEGIPYIRAEDVKNGFVDWEQSPKISEKVYQRIKRYKTTYNDVLLTIVGNSIGDIGIVKFKIDRCNLTENCVRIVSDKVKPEYLFAYLLSYYGQNTIEREKVGTAQPKLAIERINKFKIPKISNNLQEKITLVINLSYEKIKQSKQFYTRAEEILLEELNLKNFQPSNEPVNIKSFKDSFLASGRLDAEYYQKKYEDYLKVIYNYKNGYEPFNTACNLKDKNFSPNDEINYKYIELANIGKTGDITSCTIEKGKSLPTRARRIVKENDVIISSIEGSLDSCALITREYDNALCSTGFYVINSNKINSETLLILFKSELMQNILKKGCSGTILTAISKTELEQIPIPIINSTKQKEIAELVEESFALKKQSEDLLETAKRAVEIAIEESEEKAMFFLKGNK